MQLTDVPTPLADGDTVHMFDTEITQSQITVLVVDDDPNQLDLTATFLEREEEGFETITETKASDAVEYLEGADVDAIVSDYDMPRMNGLEFLETVRNPDGNIPFVLFTGKGSEEIASEAISKGVTDYLQKQSDPTQYSILANRVRNAVEQYRASEALKRSQEKFSKLVRNSTDVMAIVNENAQFEYISPACEQVLGYDQEELIGTVAFDYMPPDDREEAMEKFFAAIENPEMEPSVEFRFEHPENGWTVVDARGVNLFDDDFINGFVVNARDITDMKEQQQELRQQNEQLKDMRQIISHELKGPISVAWDSLQLYEETEDEDYVEKAQQAVSRMDTLLNQINTLAEQDAEIGSTEQVSLGNVVQSAWEVLDTDSAELHIEDSKELEADPSRLQQVFENLIRNSIDHSPNEVTIRVGTAESYIYIEDTGPGIPKDERESVFESGYTTSSDHTGFGLNIVKQIVLGHGWEIDLTESEEGGARFEITGITFEPKVYN